MGGNCSEGTIKLAVRNRYMDLVNDLADDLDVLNLLTAQRCRALRFFTKKVTDVSGLVYFQIFMDFCDIRKIHIIMQ